MSSSLWQRWCRGSHGYYSALRTRRIVGRSQSPTCLSGWPAWRRQSFAFNLSVQQWWTKRRGFALGILSSLSAVEFTLPALATVMIHFIGWRVTAIGLGVISGSVSVVCGLLLLKPPEVLLDEPHLEPTAPPEQMVTASLHDAPPNVTGSLLSSFAGSPRGLRTRSFSSSAIDMDLAGEASLVGDAVQDAVVDEPQYTLQEAIRTPLLWACFLCRLLTGLPWAGLNFFMVTLITGSGNDKTDFALVGTMTTVGAVLCSPLYGMMFDRLPPHRKKFGIALMCTTGLMVCLTAAAMFILPPRVGPVALGFMLGAWSASFIANSATLVSAYGRKSMGAISGLSMSVRVASSALGPLAFASIDAAGVSMPGLLLALAAAQLCGVITMLCVPLPQKPPGQV